MKQNVSEIAVRLEGSCALQRRYDNNFQVLFLSNTESLKELLNHIALKINEYRPDHEGYRQVLFVMKENLHTCQILISRNAIKANVIVPFTDQIDSNVAKILALQSCVMQAMANSYLNQYLVYQTFAVHIHNSDQIFNKILKMYSCNNINTMQVSHEYSTEK